MVTSTALVTFLGYGLAVIGVTTGELALIAAGMVSVVIIFPAWLRIRVCKAESWSGIGACLVGMILPIMAFTAFYFRLY